MPTWLPNWAPLFALLAVTVVLFQWLRAQKRRNALADVAKRFGLAFEAKDWGPRGWQPGLDSPHFAIGYGQAFENSISGERAGFHASFFDHVINRRNGRHLDTIASFTQDIGLPKFALTQQDTLHKIGDAIRHQKIDFPSDPGFSERYRLVGANEERVRELFTPDMREFVTTIEPEWQIEGSGHTLLMYQDGYAVKPDEYPDFVDETTEIAKKFFIHCHLKKPAF